MRRCRVAVIAAAVVLLTVLWIAWGNTALMRSEIQIAGDHIPGAFDGFRIAQVSDLHNAEFGEGNSRLLKLLAESEPDVILLTGDLVDSRRTDVDAAINFVKAAVNIAPTYYGTGNHEARLPDYATLEAGLKAAGAVMLDGTGVQLTRGEDSIVLQGMEDPGFAVTAGLYSDALTAVEQNLAALPERGDAYTVLLAHRPEFFEQYAACGVDLVFSGHAHGGQFRLPWIGGIAAPGQGLFPEYDAGVFESGDTRMVVSRGLGNSAFPFRVNNRPEIVLVELKAE